MTEQEYYDAIAKLVPEEGELPIEVINLIDAAVQEHPGSASLWQKRAHLILLGQEETPHPLEEALASYQRALELDPNNPDIMEDIGHFHDAVMADEAKGLKWFNKANEIQKGQQSN